MVTFAQTLAYICLAKGGRAGQETGVTGGGTRASGFPSNQGGSAVELVAVAL